MVVQYAKKVIKANFTVVLKAFGAFGDWICVGGLLVSRGAAVAG